MGEGNKGLTEEIMQFVRCKPEVCRNWTGMAITMGLSSRVHGIRLKMFVNSEEADVCIYYLLQDWIAEEPEKATLAGLLQALRAERHNDCANELEEKFAQPES